MANNHCLVTYDLWWELGGGDICLITFSKLSSVSPGYVPAPGNQSGSREKSCSYTNMLVNVLVKPGGPDFNQLSSLSIRFDKNLELNVLA